MSDSPVNEKKPLAFVIEDHPDVAEIFVESLRAAGFATEVIHDGEEALLRLELSTPLLITLDLHLPYASGIEVLERIRANERLADTRVVLVTADQHLAQTVQDDADLVLLKPLGFAQLRDMAARILAARK